MNTISIIKRIEELKDQLTELSSVIEKQKEVTDKTDLSWDFAYTKAIQLNNAANRLKVQVKLKTK